MSNDQILDPAEPYRFGSFAGRTCVVTGGSQGLGNAVAQLMKARGAGAIMLVGRDRAKGEAAAAALDDDGCSVSFLSADLSTTDGAELVVSTVDERYGTVDCLAACAAATWRGSVWNTTGDMWDEMLAVNVKTPGLLISGLAKIMKREAVAGSMALVGSIAHHGAIGELFPYVVAKHGLEAMVRHAAYSLRMEQIRVNLINPGWMDTPAEDVAQKKFHDAPDDWLERAEAEQPFGRILKPQEVARGICFMLSNESGMMSGASIDFDQTMPGQGPAAPFDPVPEHFPWENS
ncbi:MAG: SDR family oxidoreductase [Acidimicrobiia bacterium]|nr:SDR family oxidoreductase [Acidimicrobiia bacterium]